MRRIKWAPGQDPDDVGEHKKAGMIETSSGVTTEREGWRGGLMNRRLAAAAGTLKVQ